VRHGGIYLTLTPQKAEQENCELKASLSYMVIPCLKKKKKKKRRDRRKEGRKLSVVSKDLFL
jgi:hypothetical protein